MFCSVENKKNEEVKGQTNYYLADKLICLTANYLSLSLPPYLPTYLPLSLFHTHTETLFCSLSLSQQSADDSDADYMCRAYADSVKLRTTQTNKKTVR